ncbi:hypothetical protein EC973_001226 [Apophysomyces ossiformis]|uniref:HMG box domain-containing protein n=1 Tax=Apophysomyces ossiformis TaxID=679940 RepID=A0A8H7ENB7_9FUNG|nr:hypothetical protein EC973_001226 [Apophysomyces ossiformis]
MAAASATAASAAIQRHPGSLVADTFLNCLRLPNASVSEDDSALTEDNKRDAAEALACASADTRDQKQASFARVSFMVHGTKKASLGLDTTMFLTKNAHIKRPRNAWIHFRCHYGQALKTQDPTLRAEEISKRASRRWARLTEKEKKPWHDLAEQEKQAHKEAFPEYRYCPKRANSSTTANPSSSSGVYRLGLSSEMDLTADGDTEKKARRRTK